MWIKHFIWYFLCSEQHQVRFQILRKKTTKNLNFSLSRGQQTDQQDEHLRFFYSWVLHHVFHTDMGVWKLRRQDAHVCMSQSVNNTDHSFTGYCSHLDWQLNIFCGGWEWMGIYYWVVSESSSPDVDNVLTKCYESVKRAVVLLLYTNFYASFSPCCVNCSL